MDERTFETLEARLRNTASHFPYPVTPDVSRVEAVRRVTWRGGRPRLQWRIAWVAASILVFILLAALATPTVRAAVLEFIQIGVVRIFQTAPTPLPASPVTAMPLSTVTGVLFPTPTRTETTGLDYNPALTAVAGIVDPGQPTRTETTGLGYSPAPTAVAGIVDPGRPTRTETTGLDYNPTPTAVAGIDDPGQPPPVNLVSILDLEGQTTLAEARLNVSFPIRLPSYPVGLGLPDQVILQDHDGSVLILVWTASDDPDKARLSLHAIEPGSWTVEKVKPLFIQETTVSGQPAVWATGPYLVRLLNGDLDIRRLIDGNVLIWVEDEITYRLETDLPLAEAIRIAESLK